MKLLLFSTVLIICCIRAVHADDARYSVSGVSGLFLQSDAVVRENNTTLQIKSKTMAIFTTYTAVTILNREARKLGQLVVWYDNYKKITNIEGTIYDKFGKEVRTLDDDQINDVSGTTGASLYDDYRVKFAEMYYDDFPYTVVYKVESKLDGSFNYPEWYSRFSIYPVENASFTVSYPEEMKIRFWCNTDSITANVIRDGSLVTTTWQVTNAPPLSKDAFGEDIDDLAVNVMVAASAFEFEGMQGDLSAWDGFGKWMAPLYFSEKDKLSEAAVEEISRQYQAEDLPIVRAKKLYEYMQKKVRYISVQFGIGGWKPFPASYVHERQYGDCKALTNYMRVLLASVGIKAFPVLIKLDEYGFELKENFSSNQFNHVILGLPIDADTLYLECTSNTLPFGKLHEGIENRGGLWLSPAGSKIVNLPGSKAADNCYLQKSEVELDLNKSKCKLLITLTGNATIDARSVFKEGTPEDVTNWVKRYIELPDVHIDQFHLDDLEHGAKIQLSVNATSSLVLTKTGNRLFLLPNLTEKQKRIPPESERRYSPVRFSSPFLSVDTVVYTVPQGYTVETVPQQVNLTSEFGIYQASVTLQNTNQLLYVRKFSINQYKIAANIYSDYRKFRAAIVKADKMAVVLVKTP